MANEPDEVVTEAVGWKPTQAYAMAVFCLVLGGALGYLFRGSASRPVQASAATAQPAAARAAAPVTGMPQQMPSLDDMKRMADKQAEPLLQKLKNDPNNSSLLNQLGTLYKVTHQFQQAEDYYRKAVKADPKNVAARTDLASCLYYEGDVDGALRQLQESLQYDPKDANTLFNLGLIEWQAKKDSSSAVSAWQQLLKSNPQLADDKKAAVEKLIAQAKQHLNVKQEPN
jgi:cytochrome c-type biogenesis protein CcmH/NrfG